MKRLESIRNNIIICLSVICVLISLYCVPIHAEEFVPSQDTEDILTYFMGMSGITPESIDTMSALGVYYSILNNVSEVDGPLYNKLIDYQRKAVGFTAQEVYNIMQSIKKVFLSSQGGDIVETDGIYDFTINVLNSDIPYTRTRNGIELKDMISPCAPFSYCWNNNNNSCNGSDMIISKTPFKVGTKGSTMVRTKDNVLYYVYTLINWSVPYKTANTTEVISLSNNGTNNFQYIDSSVLPPLQLDPLLPSDTWKKVDKLIDNEVGLTNTGEAPLTDVVIDLGNIVGGLREALDQINKGTITWTDVNKMIDVVPYIQDMTDDITKEVTWDSTTDVSLDVPYVPTVPGSDDYEKKNISLKSIFPFCIPFDVYYLINKFVASPTAPKIEIPSLSVGEFKTESYTLDFSKYEEYISILRVFVVVSFIISLLVITRALMIKG